MPTNPTPNSFRGSFTAITTPFTADAAKIDFERLATQIQLQAQGGTTGIVVSGTTGESPTLEHDEYHELVTRSLVFGRQAGLMVIAGAGSNSTAHAVEMQKFAKQAGVDATLSVNPYYNKPTQEGLYRHFMTVADAAEIPVVLYNVPGRSGVALAPATVERLASHPNIKAIKEATGSTDSCGEIAMRCPGLAVLSGDDSMTLPFAAVGAVGVVSVASNVDPRRVANLCSAFLAGKWEEGPPHPPRGLRAVPVAVCRDEPHSRQGCDEAHGPRHRRDAPAHDRGHPRDHREAQAGAFQHGDHLGPGRMRQGGLRLQRTQVNRALLV
jgi:4-hydroxy-tetrahydrodipicolinate synthase